MSLFRRNAKDISKKPGIWKKVFSFFYKNKSSVNDDPMELTEQDLRTLFGEPEDPTIYLPLNQEPENWDSITTPDQLDNYAGQIIAYKRSFSGEAEWSELHGILAPNRLISDYGPNGEAENVKLSERRRKELMKMEFAFIDPQGYVHPFQYGDICMAGKVTNRDLETMSLQVAVASDAQITALKARMTVKKGAPLSTAAYGFGHYHNFPPIRDAKLPPPEPR